MHHKSPLQQNGEKLVQLDAEAVRAFLQLQTCTSEPHTYMRSQEPPTSAVAVKVLVCCLEQQLLTIS